MIQVSALRQKAERLHYLANVRVKAEHAEALHEEASILDQRADDLEAQDGGGVNAAFTGPPASGAARLDASLGGERRVSPGVDYLIRADIGLSPVKEVRRGAAAALDCAEQLRNTGAVNILITDAAGEAWGLLQFRLRHRT